MVFYSFVIDHEIPFAYDRPLCANSSRSTTNKLFGVTLSVRQLTPFANKAYQ
jgi:hypothetical protein